MRTRRGRDTRRPDTRAIHPGRAAAIATLLAAAPAVWAALVTATIPAGTALSRLGLAALVVGLPTYLVAHLVNGYVKDRDRRAGIVDLDELTEQVQWLLAARDLEPTD